MEKFTLGVNSDSLPMSLFTMFVPIGASAASSACVSVSVVGVEVGVGGLPVWGICYIRTTSMEVLMVTMCQCEAYFFSFRMQLTITCWRHSHLFVPECLFSMDVLMWPAELSML